jgi:hypothetical protein
MHGIGGTRIKPTSYPDEIRRRPLLKRYAHALAVIAAIGSTSLEASEHWTDQRDSQFGFSFSFPSSEFASVEGDGKPGFHYFAADHVDAKFLVGAWDKQDDATPEHFKRWMIANAGGYEEITYQPRGRSWFVLSGYRGDQIYYEKVMFSCGARVVNILAIAYPTSERDKFDPVVERMEDMFQPSQECADRPHAG